MNDIENRNAMFNRTVQSSIYQWDFRFDFFHRPAVRITRIYVTTSNCSNHDSNIWYDVFVFFFRNLSETADNVSLPWMGFGVQGVRRKFGFIRIQAWNWKFLWQIWPIKECLGCPKSTRLCFCGICMYPNSHRKRISSSHYILLSFAIFRTIVVMLKMRFVA